MRVTSSLWVDALIRRCGSHAVPVYVAKRGAAEAGAIFVRVDFEDRLSDLYGPAPQTFFDDDTSNTDRQFERVLERADGLAVMEYIERQQQFDSDLWIVDIEYRRDWPVDQIGLETDNT